MTTQTTGTGGRTRSAVLLTLVLGAVLAALVALVAGTAREAEAAPPEKIVFVSARTTGKGVNNPTGDYEIFRMNPNGTGLKQLTFNTVNDYGPTLSPDGQKIAYASDGVQSSNPEGDMEVYVMNAADGSGNKNLTNNRGILIDSLPQFTPDGQKIAYRSEGEQEGNPEADWEVYIMNADGTGKKNLSNNGFGVEDTPYYTPFSPDGQKIAYTSYGVQTSNPEGDQEIYVMNAADGSGQTNLTNNGGATQDNIPYFSPDGQKIVYTSNGDQASNPEGEDEVYVMNAADGSGQTNLTNNGVDVSDYAFYARFSLDGQKVIYVSEGAQGSNPEGDAELYVMNILDGSGQKNLTNNGSGVSEQFADFSPDGQKLVYQSDGAQTSNPEGESELYVMNALDGSGKKNLTNNGVRDFGADWGR